MLYSAFISYNHRDRAWAAWLHRELERYRLPNSLIGRDSALGPLGRRLPPVFQDREELAASANLASSVREALANAQSLIVICSTNGAQSHWVNEEIREFARLGRRDRIQCLIVPEGSHSNGPPLPGSEVFPPALLELGEEPLAADARKSGDGKRAAFLKLLAGVIGVRYDELRQREQARRHKRLLTLAAAASVGFLLMTALTVFALISRSQAVHERDIARQKTITAQRTTDFVKGLFQVSDPSEAKGESITAVEVVDRGAREIQGQLDNEPDVKADLISTLSEVYMGLGSFRRADDLIRRSLSLRVMRRETRARQFGVLARSQGLQANYDAAILYSTRGLTLIDNSHASLDRQLYSRLLIGKAESLAALARYDEAMRLAQRALAWDKVSDGARSADVARDLETAGLITLYSGNLAATHAFYSQALVIRIQLSGRMHPEVSHDLNNLGSTAYLRNEPAMAEQFWRQALYIDERILGADHPDLGVMLNNLARVLIEQRKFAAALPLLTRSSAIYLAQRSDTHDDLAFIFSNLALARNGVGQSAEAEQLFARALRAAQVHHNRLIAPIMVDLADLQCRRGDRATALAQLAAAAPIMKATYPDDPWRSAWVDNGKGACLLRGGDVASARLLIEATAPLLLKRWPPASLYGYEVVERRAALAGHSQR